MLDDLSTDSFINGLRFFLSIRGSVKRIRCNHESNFVGAINELKSSNPNGNDRIMNYLAERQCEFVMNAPDSSHTGVWEKQIRTVRNVLNSVLNVCPSGRLDDSSLRTVFYEVMAIVNSRPLTVSEINNSKKPLSP